MIRDVEVLIITSDLDFATDRICLHLREMGVEFLRLNRESLSSQEFILDPSGPVLKCRAGSGTWVVNDRLKSVWWRQGTFDRKFVDKEEPIEEQMSRTQWSAFMRSMMVFDSARWVNHPAHVYRAETKAIQLFEASRVGFHVPKTFMTNDKNAPVENFIGTDVALKSIDTLLLREGADQLFGYTQIENWRDVSNLSLRLAPATVQRYITNKVDLRVTVLGDKLWTVSVASSEGMICGDWRLTPKSNLEFQDLDLPLSISNKCIELTKRLGLNFGAIDLVYSGERYWFVEINPTGEWGWLDFNGRDISGSIANDLARI